MKARLLIGLLLTNFVAAKIFADGGAVGNGGGFALCQDQKFYAYDYLMTLERNSPASVSASDLNQSIQSIYAQLKRLKDPLAADFAEFFSLIYTQTKGKKFQWFPVKNLPLIWEPGVAGHLPPTCKKRKQAVYFFAPSSGVTYSSYSYDPDLINSVQTQHLGSLQVSYLWVHEWLWNYFPPEDFMKLAHFNRLLHSQGLAKMTASDYYRIRPKFASIRARF